MKPPRLFLLAVAALAVVAFAADDYMETGTRPVGSSGNARFRSTESTHSGTVVHTPHVIVAAPSTIATGQAALSTTAAQVIAANTARHTVLVRNNDASISIYVGASGVTSATGLLLKAGESVEITTTAAVFAVSASGTPTVSYFAEND